MKKTSAQISLKRFRPIIFVSLVVVALLSSCIPQKNIVLLQDKNKDQKVTFEPLEHVTDKYQLQPNDYLFIRVTTPDPKLSLFFNPQMTSGSSTNVDTKLFNYMIDDSMCIRFPYIGKIDLSGCNMVMATERIATAVSSLLQNYTLTVRLASNSFAIIGEVAKTGQYAMTRDQITIWDALAMAGGFTSYAKRKEVKVIRRDVEGTATIHTLDLTDVNIVNSEYYYIYPNDVIYARPMRIKMLGFGETLSLGLVTSLVTIYLLVRSL